MKKITNVLLSVSILLITLMLFAVEYNKNDEIYQDTTNTFKTSNILAIMLDDGNGNYTQSTSNAFPTSGYTFNTELSKCELGSKIIWNEESNTIMISSNKTDKCYIYFDITPIKIINFEISDNFTVSGNKLISIDLDIKNNTNTVIDLGYILSSNNPNIDFEFFSTSKNYLGKNEQTKINILYKIINNLNTSVTINPTLEIMNSYNFNTKITISLGEISVPNPLPPEPDVPDIPDPINPT